MSDDEVYSPYDDKTFTEVLDDYVLVRGDLSEPYARQQLVAIHSKRLAQAERAVQDAEERYVEAVTLVGKLTMKLAAITRLVQEQLDLHGDAATAEDIQNALDLAL